MSRKNVKREMPRTNGETSSRRMYRSRTVVSGTLTGLLYHSRVKTPASRKASWRRGVVAAILVLSLAPVAGAADRLERFRELAAGRLQSAETAGDGAADVERELLAIVDEEIVDSLASGGVFADPEFLRERLDGFAEAWGGAALRLTQVGPLVVGAFRLGDTPGPGWVHVYGTLQGQAGLLASLARDGAPTVHPLPPAPGGAAQFLVAWEGAATGRGTRALRLDLVRQRGEAVDTVWSLTGEGGETLMARDHRVRGGEIAVRYELHYPGWTPGCEHQTEQEDVYRLDARGTFVRVSRRRFDAWHL